MKPETTYSAILGRIISSKRGERKLGQTEVAEKSGINRSSWSRMENGETIPDAVQLTQIAEILGTTPDKLLAEAGKARQNLEKEGVTVHMDKKPSEQKSGEGFGWFLLGGALGAIVAAALSSGKKSDGDDEAGG